MALQEMVDLSIIQYLRGQKMNSVSRPVVLYQLSRYPFPSYFDNPFVIVVQQNLPIFLMLSLIVTVLYITRNIIQEKEKRLKVSWLQS